MFLLSTIILAVIQGITEFLPISSSGHLVIAHHVLGDKDTLSELDMKRLDIAVHIGTLLAVILYFHQDFIALIKGGVDMATLKTGTDNAKKTIFITIATIPVLIAGFVLFSLDLTLFDTIEIIGWTTLLFGLLLFVADKKTETEIRIPELNWKHACLYGCAQVCALIPGVSRSGITMTAGRLMGHSRVQAARISLLMGMATIAAAGILTSLSVFQDTTLSSEFLIMLGVGIAVSFITAYLSILIMMHWFKGSGSMTPFVIYRIILGGALLFAVYGGFIS